MKHVKGYLTLIHIYKNSACLWYSLKSLHRLKFTTRNLQIKVNNKHGLFRLFPFVIENPRQKQMCNKQWQFKYSDLHKNEIH